MSDWTFEIADSFDSDHLVCLYLDPEVRKVYSHVSIGTWSDPISAFHGLKLSLFAVQSDVDGESLIRWLRDQRAELDEIAAQYLGSEWDGSNHVGSWNDEVVDRLRRKLQVSYRDAISSDGLIDLVENVDEIAHLEDYGWYLRQRGDELTDETDTEDVEDDLEGQIFEWICRRYETDVENLERIEPYSYAGKKAIERAKKLLRSKGVVK